MALKHRSDLPEEIATALGRRFQSRVEQSVRHLMIDWPNLPNNVLYRLRDTNNNEDGEDKLAADAFNAGKSSAPSIISGSSGDGGSLSSSGSSSSLSPHTQAGAAFPAMRKSPMDAAPTNDSNDSNDSGENTPAATVSPDDSETAPNQPCMFLRL